MKKWWISQNFCTVKLLTAATTSEKWLPCLTDYWFDVYMSQQTTKMYTAPTDFFATLVIEIHTMSCQIGFWPFFKLFKRRNHIYFAQNLFPCCTIACLLRKVIKLSLLGSISSFKQWLCESTEAWGSFSWDKNLILPPCLGYCILKKKKRTDGTWKVFELLCQRSFSLKDRNILFLWWFLYL